MKKTVNPTPQASQAKSKRVTMELELEFYWKIQDRQRMLERETGVKLSIARICEQLLMEVLDNDKPDAKAA
jgi:hypothetical protein